MKWFGSRTAREGARPALARAGMAAWPGYASGYAAAGGGWPQSYEAQVHDGYGRNAIAQRAVRLVAESVSGAPLAASEPALARLVAARSSGQSLLEAVAAQLLLHGKHWRCSTSSFSLA